MLSLLFITTALFFVFMGRMRTGNLFSPLTFFVVFCCFWAVVSLGNPYYLYNVTTKTYILIWLYIVFFSLGFLIVSKYQKPLNPSIKFDGNDFIKTKKFLFTQIFVFIILFYYYQKYNAIASNLMVYDIRRIVYEQGLLFNSATEYIFYYWIIMSLVYGSIALLIPSFVMSGQKHFVFLPALGNCFLFGQIGQGRFIYFQMIIFFLVSISLKKFIQKRQDINEKKKIKKNWAVYALLIGAVLYLMNGATAKRLGLSMSLSDSVFVFLNTSLKQFVIYFIGPFRTLDSFITSGITQTTGHTLGRSFFSGIEEFFATLLTFISGGFYVIPTANSIASSFTGPGIIIGEGNYAFNAFYTSVMNFYLDGGIPLVILFSCFYGVLSGLVYNYCLRNINLFTFSLLIYTTYHMIASEFRWSYSAPSTWIVVFLLFWLNRKYNKISLINKKRERFKPIHGVQ